MGTYFVGPWPDKAIGRDPGVNRVIFPKSVIFGGIQTPDHDQKIFDHVRCEKKCDFFFFTKGPGVGAYMQVYVCRYIGT